jgi:phosphotransferase system enzyme I (PtsI)
VSPGVAFGHVHLIDRRKAKTPKHHVDPSLVEVEIQRFVNATKEAKAALALLKERAPDHAALLDAHQMMMEDPLLVDGTKRQIREELKCAEWALRSTVHEIRKTFDALGDEYFRERRSDVDFVGDRILSAMVHTDSGKIEILPADAVVIAHDLSPADTISLSRQRVRGFVTEVGGATSHTAILARALDIPAVVGCAGILEKAGVGDSVIVDGSAGEVVLGPTPAQVGRFKEVAHKRSEVFRSLIKESALEPVTLDGHRVTLLANIEIPDEIPAAVRAGAEGVGLYRSEFLYINRQDLPSEEDHRLVCDAILDGLGDRPATLRTFDIGSDKLAAAVRLPREHNPALGLRACRLGLARPDMLRAQLRGMIRSLSAHRRGSILLPMIGSVDELLAVKDIFRAEQDHLRAEGVDVWDGIQLGIMIELPAAVWIAEELAEVADFFSVGTNDLIQYALAIDRGNEQVAHLYQPLHPAVLRMLQHVVNVGKAAGIPVGLCGESAADPGLVPVTVGLGFDSLSMPSFAMARVRWVLRRVRYDAMRDLVTQLVRQKRHGDVALLVAEALKASVPDAIELLREAAHE